MHATLRPGRLFLDAYEPLRLLGSGGMGQAFLGRNVHTQAAVVIKVMHPHLVADELSRRRFEAEVDLLGRLRHPHVVALLDADPHDAEQPFLVQEYVAGVTLEQLLKKAPRLPVERVARLLGQLCQVLHVLHARGIVHRDLAPANLMIVDAATPQERLKLMDFGLASLGAAAGVYFAVDKLVGSDATIGGGTPDFVCPEQIRKEPVDQRGDLYGVGVLLFHMLTGRVPFAGARSIHEILLAHLESDPPLFADLGVRHVPAKVEAIIHRLLAKQPAERPKSARELADLFGQAVGFEVAAPEAFDAPALLDDTVEEPVLEDLDVLDRFEAWMPEQIAVMKLRGFFDQVGAEVLSSLPGKIRVRLLDPRSRPAPRPGGFLSLLGLKRPALAAPQYLHLELRMDKSSRGGRSLVEFHVVMEPGTSDAADDQAMRRGFGERICRELRAYLMV